MPLIVVNRLPDGITIQGHAGYAPIGHDIVCAGVSTLIQTFIASVEQLTHDELQVMVDNNQIQGIQWGNLSAQGQVLLANRYVHSSFALKKKNMEKLSFPE